MFPHKTSPWPEQIEGVISLTFDDGLPSQLHLAAPMLNDYQLRGTFYLCPKGDDWQEKLIPWHEVQQAGHEIGNHSLTHACSRAFGDQLDTRGLEALTLDDIETDVLEAQRRLNLAFPKQTTCTFCYPCYQCHVGEGLTRQSYVPVIARHFPAARGWGEVANHPHTCDLHYLWSWGVERMTGAELVGMVERTAKLARWGILTFHGIHAGNLSVADADLQELCEYLAMNRYRVWTAPVVEVAQHIIGWRQANFANSSSE